MRVICLVVMSLCLMSGIGISAAEISRSDVEKALGTLDREISRRDHYLFSRRHSLDSLRERLAERGADKRPEATWLMLRLGDSYNAFNNDSALWFYNQGINSAIRHGQDSLATVLELRHATILPLAGFSATAVKRFEAIDTVGMDSSTMQLYLSSGRQMYSYIASFFRNYPDTYEKYSALSNDFQARLVALSDSDSPHSRLNIGEFHYSRQEYAKASSILTSLLEDISDDDNIYARATHILSSVARARGDRNGQLYYLACSAISDIKSATFEVTSLQELGMLLFESGDISRANDYLSMALKNAVDCHASLRVIETSEAMPLITSAHNMEIARNRSVLIGILCVLLVMLVGMVLLLLFLRREMRRMNVLQDKLRSANKVKEVYISQFLNLCSIYMDKLNSFCKIAQRKISTGKVDDLYKMTKSGRFVEEQSREFYEVFDDAFLHIYPTFLKDVNALLRPDEQIELKDGERLNTDLRILAFMRLGIEESTRIAQVLNYSVYTIYTYRNKLKNRAINRETFEADVMKIGSLS